jgi:hypothetical protein
MCWDQSWLGIQPQSPHFIIICCPGVTQEFPKLCQQGLLECCKDTSIFTSTAYKGCQTPCMCLTLMWDQSCLGLQPQSPHFTIICCPGVTQISRWIPKALPAGAAGMLLGRIHIHIHCIWRLSNTLHVSDIDVLGSILIGSTASITALHHHLLPRSYPDF